MAEFVNPFPGIKETRPMSRSDLIRALRMDVAAEEEAAHLYTAHADATDNPAAEKILRDIANEEIVHAGEFLTLIGILSPDEISLIKEGAVEVASKTGLGEAIGELASEAESLLLHSIREGKK